ncbi:MAG: TIGR03619 family F420-dependent LLM class oxidoreductase [Dehalococcoidia bacterium]
MCAKHSPRWAARPFVALAAVATATRTLKLGTAISLVTEREPIVLAKQVATLDVLSGGRFILGVGAGWNEDEMRHHGTDPRQRWSVLEERVEAMRRLWTMEEAEYHGRHVDFSPSWQWPKPVQHPHPPILIGGEGRRVRERVVRYADGWMPIVGRDPDLAGSIAELRTLARDAGRDVTVTLATFPPTREQIEQFAELEVERVIILAASIPGDQLLPVLDELAASIAPFALSPA